MRTRPRLRSRRTYLPLFLAVALAAAGLASGQATAADPVASTSDGSSVSRSSITLARPIGTQAGHVLVAAVVINDDDPAFTPPSGWTRIRQDALKNKLRQEIFFRVATSSEPVSYTWKLSTGRRIAGGITAYAGVDPADPIDVHGATTTATSTTSVTAPSSPRRCPARGSFTSAPWRSRERSTPRRA